MEDNIMMEKRYGCWGSELDGTGLLLCRKADYAKLFAVWNLRILLISVLRTSEPLSRQYIYPSLEGNIQNTHLFLL
jgi:hypothetical protein